MNKTLSPNYVVYNNHILLDLYIIRPIKQGKKTDDNLLSEKKIFKLNLEMIDSKLPQILAHAIRYSIVTNTFNWVDIISFLIKENPIGYNSSTSLNFYEVKLKSFLTAIALGMSPKFIWSGVPDSVVGIMVINKLNHFKLDYIYNKVAFEEYLFNNTSIRPSVNSYRRGVLINLQIVLQIP